MRRLLQLQAHIYWWTEPSADVGWHWDQLSGLNYGLRVLWKTDAVKEAQSCSLSSSSELWSPISTECEAKSMQLMQICAVWREQKLICVWKFLNFVKRWNSLTDSSRFRLVGRIHSALKQREDKQEQAGGSRVKPQELWSCYCPLSSVGCYEKQSNGRWHTLLVQLLWDTNNLLTLFVSWMLSSS